MTRDEDTGVLMDARMTYGATAAAARALGLTPEQADAGRYAAMNGTDGTGRILYDAYRFVGTVDAATLRAFVEGEGVRTRFMDEGNVVRVAALILGGAR